MSDRVYIVVPRNLELPDPPHKLCMSCGRMGGHVSHISTKLTLDLVKNYLLTKSLFKTLEQIAEEVGKILGDEDVITLQVENNTALETLCAELDREHVAYVQYHDVDKTFTGEQLTAIATLPIAKNQSNALKHLRPWKCACNEVPA